MQRKKKKRKRRKKKEKEEKKKVWCPALLFLFLFPNIKKKDLKRDKGCE